jgi:hypothetical protein
MPQAVKKIKAASAIFPLLKSSPPQIIKMISVCASHSRSQPTLAVLETAGDAERPGQWFLTRLRDWTKALRGVVLRLALLFTPQIIKTKS